MESCRFCGSDEVHTRQYGQPTSECVQYLRAIMYRYERLHAAAVQVFNDPTDDAMLSLSKAIDEK